MWDHETRDHRLVVIVRCEISEARSDSGTPSHGGRISAILVLEYLLELIQLDLQGRISHCSCNLRSNEPQHVPLNGLETSTSSQERIGLVRIGRENELPT